MTIIASVLQDIRKMIVKTVDKGADNGRGCRNSGDQKGRGGVK